MRPRLKAWLLVAVLTGLALAGLIRPDGSSRLVVDPGVAALGGEKNHDRRANSSLLARVTVDGEWQPEDILAIAKVMRRLTRTRGVSQAESAFTANHPAVDGDDIEIASLVSRLRKNPERSRELLEQVFDEPLFAGRLVSDDRKSIALWVAIHGDDEVAMLAVAQKVEKKLLDLEAASSDRLDVKLTGAALVQDAVGTQILEDLRLVLVLSSLIIPIVLLLTFTYFGVLWVLPTICIALLWSLAAMAVAGIPINLVTTIVPPLVMALTLAYSMHALFDAAHAEGGEDIWRQLSVPLLVTGVTTGVGILALALQDVPAIRQFAVAGAMGVVCSVVSVLLILCLGSPQLAGKTQVRPWLNMIFQKLAAWSTHAVENRRRMILVAGGVILLLGLLASSLIRPGARYVSDLSMSHPVRAEFEAVNSAFEGANGFEVIFHGPGPDSVLLPGVLRDIADFQTWLAEQPEVGGTTSLVDYVRRLNQVFNENASKAARIPDDLATIKQLLMVAAPPEAMDYTDLQFTRLVVQVRSPSDDAAVLGALIRRIEAKVATMRSGTTTELKGSAVTLARTVFSLTTGQIKSLMFALLVIFVVLGIQFGSAKLAMLAMVPNILPVAVYYGLMGMTGIPFSPTMALVACIVLGIAVDDTVFYLVRFERAARRLASEARATAVTLRELAGPVTMTTLVLVLCFLALSTSHFQSQVIFAIFAAITLIVAWVSDMTLTPSIVSRAAIVTLWDELQVDLGSMPHESIPLFHGLTGRQARIFALMSRFETVEAGQCFISVGDEANNMFVLIEGEAEVWIDGPDGRIELNRFGRGDCFGETGVFEHYRTANVSAVDRVRLLVFGEEDLMRIAEKHPRTAAVVMLNLNRIQAARLAMTTALLGAAKKRV